MNLFTIAVSLESDENLHCARVLVLLRALSGNDGTRAVDSVTKLAKLDYLLRYPALLERALTARGASTRGMQVDDHDKQSIEATMVPFGFRPWDARHRRVVNIIAARGLCSLAADDGTISITITLSGRALADRLAADPSYANMMRRAQSINTHLDMTTANLSRFLYHTFPEISTLSVGEALI